MTSEPREWGTCLVTRITDRTGRDILRIDQADPRVRICADILQEISILTERDEPRGASLVGDVLTFHGDNRTVIYRVNYTDWDAQTDTYGAEWPD